MQRLTIKIVGVIDFSIDRLVDENQWRGQSDLRKKHTEIGGYVFIKIGALSQPVANR